jgi:hypothetical protein
MRPRPQCQTRDAPSAATARAASAIHPTPAPATAAAPPRTGPTPAAIPPPSPGTAPPPAAAHTPETAPTIPPANQTTPSAASAPLAASPPESRSRTMIPEFGRHQFGLFFDTFQRKGDHPWTLFSFPAQYRCFSIFFRIFPVPVFGSGSSRNSITLRLLEPPQSPPRELQQLLLTQTPPLLQHNQCRRHLTPLFIRRRHHRAFQHGSCAKIAFSTSMDEIFSPPEIIISFRRSTI